MNKKYFILVFLFNLIIAIAYFLDNINAPVTEISSDLANIIPICKKIDNPSLFAKDLYLNDINNVKYYTPFYVQTLRFIAKFTNYDYLKALNILSFFTHFFYGMLWFYFFYFLKKDFWLAFGFSIFMRGVIWPPGYELLGISDLWTIMPRTVFIALIPIPFLIYKLFKRKLFLGSIILGLLVNFHPISGIGAIIVYFSVFISYNYLQKEISLKNQFYQIILVSFGVLIGMAPYFITYISNVKKDIFVDQKLFEAAFHARIDDLFFDGILFIKNWHRPFTYFFGLFFVLFYFFDSSLKKNNFKILFFSISILLIFANTIPFVEKLINQTYNLNLRLAFQLIRSQKLILIIMQVGMFLFLYEVIKKYDIKNIFKILFFLIYLILLSLTSVDFMTKTPFFRDDISRLILPDNLKFESRILKKDGIIDVFEYVNKNTKITDLFYCKNVYFRTATNRSEVLDFHAAGMLIEGNPKTYINAYLDNSKFNNSNFKDKIELLKSKKVNYIIDSVNWTGLTPIIKIKEYYIYKL